MKTANELRSELKNELLDFLNKSIQERFIANSTVKAIKANELMKQHNTMKVEDFRELPEVKRLWNAMDVIKEHYL